MIRWHSTRYADISISWHGQSTSPPNNGVCSNWGHSNVRSNRQHSTMPSPSLCNPKQRGLLCSNRIDGTWLDKLTRSVDHAIPSLCNPLCSNRGCLNRINGTQLDKLTWSVDHAIPSLCSPPSAWIEAVRIESMALDLISQHGQSITPSPPSAAPSARIEAVRIESTALDSITWRGQSTTPFTSLQPPPLSHRPQTKGSRPQGYARTTGRLSWPSLWLHTQKRGCQSTPIASAWWSTPSSCPTQSNNTMGRQSQPSLWPCNPVSKVVVDKRAGRCTNA